MRKHKIACAILFFTASAFLILTLFGGLNNHGTHVIVSKHCEQFQVVYACLSALCLIGLCLASSMNRDKKESNQSSGLYQKRLKKQFNESIEIQDK
jgi:hypothetical protein